MYLWISLTVECELCGVQFGGVGARWRQWSVGPADVSSAAYTQGCPLPAGSALSARCHAAHHGQRRNLLRSTRPLHLHLQVLHPSVRRLVRR